MHTQAVQLLQAPTPASSHLFLLAPLPDPLQASSDDHSLSSLEEKRIIPFQSLLGPSSKSDPDTRKAPIIPFHPPLKTPFKAQNRTHLIQENQITEYLYDLLNRRIQTTQILVTPADNIVTTTEYDVMGNQVKVIGPRTNQSTQFEYDGLGRNTKTVVNLDGTATVTTTNNNNHVITGIDATKDLVTSREYDANSNLTKVTVANTPANQETVTTYDVLNRQTQVVDPEGSTTLTFYDLNSNVTKTEDADHFVTTYEFDAANRSIKTTFPNTHSTTASYDQNSNVITSTDRRNTETETTYDALNRPLESTLKADEDVPTKRQYDQAGNLSVFTDRREHTTHTCFDFANRPILTTMPPMDNTGGSGSTRTKINRTFDNIGNLCALTGDVIEESSRYDRANRRIMHKTGADTDPTQQVVENTFDHSGNVVEQMVKNDAASGGDQVTTYQHDLADRQTQEKLPTVNPTVYTYDRASNILTETDPNGEVVTHAYFKDNLLASKTYSDPAQNKSFTYDARKNPNVVTDETGTLITTYNAMNWLAEEKKMDIPNLLVSTVNHTYDQDGNRIITDYSNTDTIEYAYDKEDRRTQIKQDQKTTTFAYVNDNTANTITTVKPGNEVTIKTFNANGMLQQAQTTRFGKNLYTALYQFNAIGQRERADETHAESGDPNFRQQTCNYLYDTTGRLGQEAISGGATCTYAYDKAGNRITKTVGADTWTYTVNVLNQITQIQYPDTSIVTLSYDQNGNMKTKGARIFTYDIDNRLVDVENNVGGSSAGDLFSATYDHRNRRFQKTEDGTSTVFAHDNMEVIQELDTAYNVQKEFVRNAFDGTPGEIIHSSTGDEVTNYNFNTVGSTTGIRKRTYPPEIIPSTPTGILPGDLDNTTLYTEVYGNVIDDGGIFVFNPDDLPPEVTHVDPTSITPTQLSDTALYTEIYGTVTLDNGQYRFQADQTASPGQDDYDFELAGNPLPFNHTNVENRFFRGLALEFVVLEGTVVSEFAIDPATIDRTNPPGVDPKEFKLGGNPLPFDHTNTKLRFFQGTGGEFYVLESQTVNEFEIDESTAIISQDDIAFSDAWGNINSGGDLSLNNRLFNSKEVDNTGLVYFGYRYYDPEIGRFINRDLIGFPDGPNNYLYTNNDPVNHTDHLGSTIQEEDVGGSYKGFISGRERFIYTSKGGWLDRSHFLGSTDKQSYQKAYKAALDAIKRNITTQVEVKYNGVFQDIYIKYKISPKAILPSRNWNGEQLFSSEQETARQIALGIMASLFRTGEGKQSADIGNFLGWLFNRIATDLSLEDLPTNWASLLMHLEISDGNISEDEVEDLLKSWLGNVMDAEQAKELVRQMNKNGDMLKKNDSFKPILFEPGAIASDIFVGQVSTARTAYKAYVTAVSGYVQPHTTRDLPKRINKMFKTRFNAHKFGPRSFFNSSDILDP